MGGLNQDQARMASILAVPCCLVLLICILLAMSFDTVEVDEMALKWNRLSCSLADETKMQGRHHLWPGQQELIKYTRRYQTVQLIGGKQIDCLSSDGVLSYVEISFQYQMMPEELRDTLLDFGEQPHLEKYLVNLAQDATREACSAFTAEEFFQKRIDLAERMQQILQNKAIELKSHAEVKYLQLKFITLPQRFDAAVTAKQNAEIEIAMMRDVERPRLILEAQEDLKVAGLEANRSELQATSLAAAEVMAAELEAKGITDEFRELVDTYRQYRQHLCLNTTDFVRSYLVSRALRTAGKPVFFFKENSDPCISRSTVDQSDRCPFCACTGPTCKCTDTAPLTPAPTAPPPIPSPTAPPPPPPTPATPATPASDNGGASENGGASDNGILVETKAPVA